MHVGMHINHHGIHNNYCNLKCAIQVVCTACHKEKFARNTNWQTCQNEFLQNKMQSSTKETETVQIHSAINADNGANNS
jgi:hypothetical protein